MSDMKRLLPIVAAWILVLSACSIPEPISITPTPLSITPTFFPTDTPTPTPNPLRINLIWHFHLPSSAVDPQTGLLVSPLARQRVLGDYHHMIALLQQYPEVKMTLSFSPLLLQELDALSDGARDQLWELAARPVDSLSEENRQFIVEYFFAPDAAPAAVASGRYQELLQKRGGGSAAEWRLAAAAFTDQDIRDLQVWHILSAFDRDLLDQSPLRELAARDRGFSEEDKLALFSRLLELLRQMNPSLSELQERGQIELSASPYAQPILPLLLDSNSARSVSATMTLPQPAFSFAQDAAEQLKRAGVLYQRLYGRAPVGLVPTAGAMSAEVTPLIANSGYQWFVTGEDVLARSLDRVRFTRDDSSMVQDADALYRPYQLQSSTDAPLYAFFSDQQLSKRFEDTYGALNPRVAVDDFVTRLMAIHRRLENSDTAAPHLVTMVIDGERALSAYPDRGRALLRELLQRLTQTSAQAEIITTTPAQYLSQYPQQRSVARLASGTWDVAGTSDFSPFIGTSESNTAWANLQQARAFLEDYLTGTKIADPTSISRAYDAMLLAESSDWLLWHAPQAGGKNGNDQQFRDLLGRVYTLVGAPVPSALQVPIIPPAIVSADLNPGEAITPTTDGFAAEGEWDSAGRINAKEGEQSLIRALHYGFNSDNLFFRIDAQEDWAAIARRDDTPGSLRVGIYLAYTPGAPTSRFSRVGGDGEVRMALGMSATHLLEWSIEPNGQSVALLYAARPGGWSGTATVFAPSAATGNVLELYAPAKALGGMLAGAPLTMTLAVVRNGQVLASFPSNGLAQMTLPGAPQQATATDQAMLAVDDPIGDDNGPGSYTYPTSLVFTPGSYDIKRADIMVRENTLAFRIELNSAIDNVWNSPIGLSIQTFDIYIDKDPGKATGERKLLAGRNAALPREHGWEYAIWVEGWAQELLMPDGNGGHTQVTEATVTVEIDPTGIVLVEIPLAALGEGNPSTWGYAIVLLSQEAFPTPGVLRVRDVEPQASEWRIGGAPAATNHTRILDVLMPANSSVTQQDLLSQYTPSIVADATQLTADDFGSVPLITIQP